MSYVQTDQSLPRSLDVQISLSRPQSETRTNLSVACFVGEDLGFLPDANRIRYYSTLDSVLIDFASSTEPYKAAAAFFAQTPRATTMAIAEAFSGAQNAMLVAGDLSATEIAALKLITTGSMKVTLGVTATDLTGMDFSSITDLASIATIIQAKLTTAVLAATCTVKTLPGGAQRLVITSTATPGPTDTISYPIAAASGVNVSALLNMTLASGGKVMNGYTPANLADELTNIKAAANASGTYVYGWCLSASFRLAATQEIAATWALGQTAIMPLVSNDVSALDASFTTDIGKVLSATSNRRVVCIYHDNANYYPDMSILAYMLSVNYQMQNSTVTAKFKQLPGIPTVILTETQWSILKNKGYNTYVAVGNSAKTYRDGTTEDEAYFLDSTINFDNFIEDLSVNVFNVFLRNKKVPYTRRGQMLLVDACRDTANQYIYNGTFADREAPDSTNKAGYTILPAVDIIPTPISQMSAADRASRVGPPISMICQEAGAIHSVAVAVEVVS